MTHVARSVGRLVSARPEREAGEPIAHHTTAVQG
jgi:hypothetical protein